METMKTLKRSLGGHKGQLKIALLSFKSILAVKPQPTYTALEQAYTKVCCRIEAIFTVCDSIMSHLCEVDDTEVDVGKETNEIETYLNTLITERGEVESSFVELQIKQTVVTETLEPSSNTDTKPRVRISPISPPTWNGNKADFYSWKEKFVHIMTEAGINDDLTQVCYLQEKRTLPPDYQILITDCTNMKEAWDRLQERIPKDTIKYEVIGQFRNLQSLSKDRSPSQLRDFANEISMFCRRMSDLGLSEDNYNCIAMQDIYDRLDSTTALNYRSRNELKRDLGQPASEDIKSLCSFIRSEATTLELTGSNKPTKKVNFLHNKTDPNDKDKEVEKPKCYLGCEIKHRLVDCEKYMEKSTDDRIEVLRTMSRCFICLGVGHVAGTCARRNNSNWICRLCSKQNHHWTVCSTKSPGNNFNANANIFVQKSSNFCTMVESSIACECEMETTINTVNRKKVGDYPPVVLVEVLTKSGNWRNAKCLLDGGSNWSLVRSGFAEFAGLDDIGPSNATFGVAGGGVHNEEGAVHDFNIQIRGKGRTDSYNITATGIKKPCFDTPHIPSSIFAENPHLQEDKSTIYVNGGEIDILVGSDYGCLIQSEGNTRAPTNPDDHPSIAHTRLGNFIYSELSPQSKTVNNHEIQLNYIKAIEEDQLNKFFYNDIIGVKPTSTCVCSDKEIAEAAFIKHVKQTTHINSDGRVSTAIPWKPGFPENLPNNYERAYDTMIKMENRLENENKIDIHNEQVQELLDNGYVRILSPEETNKAKYEPGWYLNNRVVERPDKTSTKFRLVFNSAAKYNGVCLNDAMEKGPDYLNSMFSCFIKWRKDTVAINGDIKKMFNQVVLAEKDRRYHRFLWRFGKSDSDALIFEWERLLFGDKGSPDLAAFAIKLLSEDNKDTLPIGSDILNTSTYVDDITHSEPNDENAAKAIEETDNILSKGKFSIKVWNSNSVTVNRNPEIIVNILGHQWNKDTDTIILKFKDMENVGEFTKRIALRCCSKCWDLAGLLFPVIIKYRIDLQRIWLEGYGWDEILPSEHQEIWQNNLKEMLSLEIEINRCLKPKGTIGLPQIHSFADGGDHAFGTCVFIRWNTTEGVIVKLVSSKAFVAPLKQKTTPRLELMGAVGMSRLTNIVLSALDFEIEFKKFWIDSEIVLWWLMSQSCKYKPFVSSRIQEFQDTHTSWKKEINYVPSDINPADCLTKPIAIEHLKSWQDGEFHNFLKLPVEQFPEQPDFQKVKPCLPSNLLEEKVVAKRTPGKKRKSINIHAVTMMDAPEQLAFDEQIALNFSSWNKLVRSLAYLIQSLKNKSFQTQVRLIPNELSSSQNMLFLICQRTLRNDIAQTKQRFHKFSVVEDPSGLIRVKGRLEKTSLPDEVKHPILLPSEHPITRLLAIYHHRLFLHQGYRVVLANLANLGIMIGNGMELLKSIASRCLFCRIRRRKLLEQQMGQLPNFRIQVRMPPFTSVALDYFGNLKVKLTRNTSINGLVMIVTCCTTRCIHLEVCLALDTNTFLKAWRRFVSRRGVHPHLAFSDNGGAFQGAHDLISEWIKEWDRELIEKAMADKGTKFNFNWEFNVPTASHMNGVVESLINSVRKGLDAAITNYTKTMLTFEEWATVISEITYVVNSRPLFPDGDPLQMSCITGNNLLHPHGQPQVPQLVPEERINPRDMLKVAQGKTDIFWETWIKHMPPQLISRNKWFHTRNNLEIGDFVINLEPGMKGKYAPRSQWKKGIVTKVHPGTDGLVRSVTIRDSNHRELVRPINKLCLIATRGELEEEN